MASTHLALLLSLAALAGSETAAQSAFRILTCTGPFAPGASADTLARDFGSRSVTHGDLPFPEGETMPGTLLFAGSPRDQLEILWKDAVARQRPESVMLRMSDVEALSRWRTNDGLTLGMDLAAVERLNGAAFRLLGFAWDYEGGVVSWNGGRLEAAPSAPCRVDVRFTLGEIGADPARQRWFKDVSGDREFVSTHPSMQALRPIVREVWLTYR